MKQRFLESLRVGLVLGLLAAGCAGGQSGTEGDKSGPACEEVHAAPIEPDETTVLGSAQGLVELVAGEARVPLTWYGHGAARSSGATEVRLAVTALIDTARLVRQRATDGNLGSCPDFLAIDAVLTFETADGMFDETFRGSLASDDGATARFSGSFAADDLAGTYDASSVLRSYVDPELTVHLWWSPEPAGSVSAIGLPPDDDPNTTAGSPAIADFGE